MTPRFNKNFNIQGMKKIMALLLLTTLTVYAQAGKAKFTAIIKNSKSDSLVLTADNFRQVVKASKPGEFSAVVTLGTNKGFILQSDKNKAFLFLKEGFDVTMRADAENFEKTIYFTGTGNKDNNFAALVLKSTNALSAVLDKDITREEANNVVLGFRDKLYDYGNDAEIDKELYKELTKSLAADVERFNKQARIYIENGKFKGKPSPSFSYENFKGGNTKLEDFKGKYVFIATSDPNCDYCPKDILGKLTQKYKDKNIAFINIALSSDHDAWKKHVKDNNLTGVQLFGKEGSNATFIEFYKIEGVHYILLDPQGDIIDVDAWRPSMPGLWAQLDTLLK